MKPSISLLVAQSLLLGAIFASSASCSDPDPKNDGGAAGTPPTAGANTGGTSGGSTAGTAQGGNATAGVGGGSAGTGGGTPPAAIIEGKLAGAVRFACAIDAEDALACWGNGTDWSDNDPEEAGKKWVAGGGEDRCSIGQDDTITCVGDLESPTGTFKQVAVTGNGDGCGIATDGSATCWGPKGASWTVPTGAFKFIAAGLDFVCGVQDAGTVECWGDATAPTAPTGTFAKVYASRLTACAVAADAKIACVGSNASDVPAALTAEQIAIGDRFVCALQASGQVQCVGRDGGVVGSEPTETFSAIVGGGSAVCGFTTSHKLLCWGSMLGMPPANFVAP